MAAPTAETQPAPALAVQNPHARGTAEYYLWQLDRLEDELANITDADRRDALSIKRDIESWIALATQQGIDLKAIRLDKLDPIQRLLSRPDLTEYAEKELTAIRESIEAADAVGAAELSVKKKWLGLIDETIRLHNLARSNPIYFTIYVVRDQENNAVLMMEPVHIGFFRIWNDPAMPNSVIMAPPGVGKTTTLYGQELWDLAHDTTIRLVKICAKLEAAQERREVIRGYCASARMKALYPHIQVDPTKSDNLSQFTLVRPNIGSHDPTFKAAGAMTEIQGAGLERIHADDMIGSKQQWEPSRRRKAKATFHGVAMTRRRDLARSKIRYIATPWHPDDLTFTLARDIREGKMPGWSTHSFPVAEDAEGTPIPVITRAGRAADIATVKAIRPEEYARLYRLDPRDPSQRKLKGLVYYDISGGKAKLCPENQRQRWAKFSAEIDKAQTWEVLDPGFGGRDKTAMVRFALMASGRAPILASRSFDGRSPDTISEVTKVLAGDPQVKVLIENQGAQKGNADMWGAYIIAAAGRHFSNRIFFSGTRMRDKTGKPVGQNISKANRYYATIPYLNSGTILLPGQWVEIDGEPKLVMVGDPNIREVCRELLDYPNVTEDHALDCVTMFANYNVGSLSRAIEALPGPEQHAETLPPTTNILTLLWRESLARKKQPKPTPMAEEFEMLAGVA